MTAAEYLDLAAALAIGVSPFFILLGLLGLVSGYFDRSGDNR